MFEAAAILVGQQYRRLQVAVAFVDDVEQGDLLGFGAVLHADFIKDQQVDASQHMQDLGFGLRGVAPPGVADAAYGVDGRGIEGRVAGHHLTGDAIGQVAFACAWQAGKHQYRATPVMAGKIVGKFAGAGQGLLLFLTLGHKISKTLVAVTQRDAALVHTRFQAALALLGLLLGRCLFGLLFGQRGALRAG